LSTSTGDARGSGHGDAKGHDRVSGLCQLLQ
jgi:hypothetical protein